MSNSDALLDKSLAEGIKQAFRVLLAEELHTCLPGLIEEYDSKTRKATITPLITKKYIDGSTLELQPIAGVPVTFIGAGNSGLRLPEKEIIGQQVMLVFSERSIDNWVLDGKKSEPGSTNKFDLTDAIAICFINDFSKEDAGGNDLSLFYGDNSIIIKSDGDIIINGGNIITVKSNGDIEIGSTGLRKLITDDLITLYNTHTHSGVTSGTAATATPLPQLTSAIATTKTEAQ